MYVIPNIKQIYVTENNFHTVRLSVRKTKPHSNANDGAWWVISYSLDFMIFILFLAEKYS